VIDTAKGLQEVGAFRRMLLEVLTAQPGSIEAEEAYLRLYRQGLRSLVEGRPPPHDAMTALRTGANK
jgi:hypothetical protein